MNGLSVHLVTTMKNKGKTSEEKKDLGMSVLWQGLELS